MLCHGCDWTVTVAGSWNVVKNNNNTCLTAIFPELSRWANTRKVKPIWLLLKQDTVSDSGISWAICKFAPCTLLQRDNYASTLPLSFLQAGCPSCHPTNSVKALKCIHTCTIKQSTPFKHSFPIKYYFISHVLMDWWKKQTGLHDWMPPPPP